MVSYALSELFINNSTVLSMRISCLTNTYKNSIFVLATSTIGILGRFKLRSLAIMAAICLTGGGAITPALTNTMFSIHPPMLYFCSICCLCHLIFSSRMRVLVFIKLFGFSMALGGFWSMQELSWGGWWNWDVLECGIAYIWFILVIIVHNKELVSLASRVKWSILVMLCLYAYNTLNKSGLATSIHSFVTSRSVKNQYHSIILTYAITFAFSTCRSFYQAVLASAVLVFAYSSLKWCIFLKKPIIAVALTIMLSRFNNKPFTRASHYILLTVCAFALISNFYNQGFVISAYCRVWASQFDCTNYLWGCDYTFKGKVRFVFDKLALSKPRYNCHFLLDSRSSRNFSGRQSILSFLK